MKAFDVLRCDGKICVVFLMAAFACAEAAPSVLKGDISGFLTKSGSPYTVEETVVVGEGKALVVKAGVTLNFKEGTGLEIRGGSLAVVGEEDKPVVFSGVDGGSWNGVSLTGLRRTSLANLEIDGSEIGIAVESNDLDMVNVDIRNTSRMALYAKDARVEMTGGALNYNAGVALWVDENSAVTASDVSLFGNKTGVLLSEKSNLALRKATVSRNEIGIIAKEWSGLDAQSLQVEGNKVGFVAKDTPSDAIRASVGDNDVAYSQDVEKALGEISDSPENPAAATFSHVHSASAKAPWDWTASGNVTLAGGYHAVMTAEDENGDDYTNYFQVPGFFGNLNAYLLMQSNIGQTLEVTANLSSDKWTYFNPEQISVVYTDSLQRAAIGDMSLSAGELYLAGVDLFGGSYDIGFLRNSANEPMFNASIFGGETRAPKVLGERNRDIYKDYVEDGEAEPQQLMVGGKLRFNLDRGFNVTAGYLASKDYLDDPLLRDGSSANANTAVPLTSSKTFFADANWKFFPGDISLNVQAAVGGADTANVLAQRAVNSVFSEAGLDASNFSKLRRLMNDTAQVNLLTRGELEEIFGDNSGLTDKEMYESLKKYLARAQNVLKNSEKSEDSRSEIKDWDGDNFAFDANLLWNLKNTTIAAEMRFVGADFYSVGSPDQLQNARLWALSVDQKISDFWKLGVAYKLNVENAAHDDEPNVFGFAEGSSLGLVPGADSDWLKEHENDENRTLYDHNASIENVIDIGSRVELSVGYAMNYRTRSTNQRLYGDFSANSGIYSDSWFASRGGATVDVYRGDDTLKVDSARWAAYYALADEAYLASQFEERLMKHTVNLEVKLSLPKNVLKLGGIWTIRQDLSKFENDALLDGFDFSDETFGILGYYFHGGDYFEQRYPVSLATSIGGIRNMLSVVPRYKVYNRDDMTDFEWSVSDNFSMPIVKDFMDLGVSARFRQEFLNYDEDGESVEEEEMDISAAVSLKVKHTKKLTTEWAFGTYCNFRPDRLSEEYEDIYGMIGVNYAF